MEQYYIDKLWEHTDHNDETNRNEVRQRQALNKMDASVYDSPDLLPSSWFLKDDSSDLFLSFHHEAGNLNRHYHDFFEIIYVFKGKPVGIINDQELSMEAGNLCIMNPNAIHYFTKYSEETDLILNIVLPKELFQKSIFRALFNDPVLNAFFIRYRLENLNQPSFLYLQHLDEDIDHLIDTLVKEYLDNKQYSHVIIEALLTLIFSFILRRYKESSSHGGSAMAEVIDYIYLNYQTVTMKLVASHFNYHPKYLSTLIHRQTGQTFRDLIVNIKLQNALNYLLYTDYSVEQIVDLIGYKDKSSFYTLFKKEYSMSPAGYRRKFR